ncbi:MAG: FHA domain-containing protein [Myxococcaceae bacterium]|nr:FHA domain-containing protein [Myxococcaceae bacterium]
MLRPLPALEVLATASADLSVGAWMPLVDGFTLGRTPQNGLQLVSGLVSARYARIESKFGRWWLFDQGSTNGTWKNGERVRDAELCQGDVVELPNGTALRVWLSPPPPENEALERAVLDDLDDDERWLVWGDWLIEHGNPAGARVVGEAQSLEDDARALGPLAAAWRDGWLDVDWRHGFPRRLVVRSPGPVASWLYTPVGLMERALDTAACRFLRHLEVDPASFGTGLRAAQDVEALLESFATRANAVPLESVRIGPVGLAALPERLEARWSEARVRQPRLTTPAERLLFSSSQATLEVLSVPDGVVVRPPVGRSIGLSGTSPNFIGQLDECAVHLTASVEHAAAALALRVEAEGARWFVEDIAGLARARTSRGPLLRVNGRERLYAHLRDGDELEPMDGLRLRFRLR